MDISARLTQAHAGQGDIATLGPELLLLAARARQQISVALLDNCQFCSVNSHDYSSELRLLCSSLLSIEIIYPCPRPHPNQFVTHEGGLCARRLGRHSQVVSHNWLSVLAERPLGCPRRLGSFHTQKPSSHRTVHSNTKTPTAATRVARTVSISHFSSVLP